MGTAQRLGSSQCFGVAASLLSCLVCAVRLYIVHQSTGKLDEAPTGAGIFSAILALPLAIPLYCRLGLSRSRRLR